MYPALGLVQETARADLSWADMYPCGLAHVNQVMKTFLGLLPTNLWTTQNGKTTDL